MSRLLVISHTPHYISDKGEIVGWGPTVRELDHLAKAFGELEHLAPMHKGNAPESMIPYENTNVLFTHLTPSGGNGFMRKMGIIRTYPQCISRIRRAIEAADVVQVRCPCNIAIPALIYLAFEKRTPRWAKYAGNWIQKRAPISYRFQRWWLKNRLHHGLVTINGNWPDQPDHIFSFHNPCFTKYETQEEAEIVGKKKLTYPLKLIYVGRVESTKGVGRILEITYLLKESGINLQLDVIGDGPERDYFEVKSAELNLTQYVNFRGWLPRHELGNFYSKAHFLVFPSNSEGFPKVISEAMAYGVVTIAGSVSCIPQILIDSQAGVAVDPHDKELFKNSILNYLNSPEDWEYASEAGKKYARKFTYQKYIDDLKNMFDVYQLNNLMNK